ncbi:MAG: AAA family ATPase [Ardenticatenaceae bacterium]|nr:AAA family ATPase [Ardenticatenaceae bacterium]
MELLFIDGLSPNVGKGGILRLLIEVGQLNKQHIGKITLNGGLATIEIAGSRAARLAHLLDGHLIKTRHIRVWQQASGDSQPHFAQLRRWLALEADAEQQQFHTNPQAQSEYALTRLVIRSEDMGLGGRILLQLAPRNEQAPLPFSRLSTGSPIMLVEEGESQPQSWRGVISRLSSKRCEIALNQSPESAASTFRITLANDEIARQRMERALTRVEAARGNRTAVLRDIILGEQPATYANGRIPANTAAYTSHLNPSQQEAVRHALSAEDIAIIHGPPGTGKTTTVAALICTAVARGDRILACAPSNLAVDNLAEQLAAAGVPLARIGHPARILPELQAHTLDALVERQESYRQAKKLRKQAFGLRDQAGKFRRARPAPGEKQALRTEAAQMLDEARQLEAQAIELALDGASVILSTLTAVDSAILGQRQFDLCVIDEAGQSTEPAVWIPVTRSDRLVLAGDHQQLPPTIVSPQAQEQGFGISLLERLMRRDGALLARRLDVQYRMNEQIMNFSSAVFYDGDLQADASVQGHLLCDLPGVVRNDLTATAVTFIDTAGAGYDDSQPADSDSRHNLEEAALAARKAQQLLDANVSADSIAIITPYSAQVQRLRELLPDEVRVGTVDGFQGREMEAIIISLVRSNREGRVGFLAETRRINVALTRARRKLIVIGDSATIASDPFYGRLLDYFDTIGAYHSVWEELA